MRQSLANFLDGITSVNRVKSSFQKALQITFLSHIAHRTIRFSIDGPPRLKIAHLNAREF